MELRNLNGVFEISPQGRNDKIDRKDAVNRNDKTGRKGRGKSK